MKSITIWGILARWLAAMFLVFATYNPSGRSYYHWVLGADQAPWALQAAVGIALAACLLAFLVASLKALGLFGLVLAGAVLSSTLWTLQDVGVLGEGDRFAEEATLLAFLASLLAIGVCWSHIKLRLSGQIDSNDVTNPA